MNALFPVKGMKPGKYGAALYLALIAAGLAGNYFKYPVFLDIDLLFGSIFAMLALQTFGLGRGALAAACISGYTYVLWNHPYAIIVMTLEVAFVGWLRRRLKLGLVLADAVYWLCVGMPLVYFFYHDLMHIPLANTTIVMTKQAVNGIANALLARLVFTAIALRSRATLIAYRDIIYNLLAFFALCPALILLMVASKSDFAETDHNIRAELGQKSVSLTDSIEVWVRNRTTTAAKLAALAATLDPQQMQGRLEQAQGSDENILRLGLMNKQAVSVAYFPPTDELGRASIGKSFGDRPYIPTIRRTLEPMLSEALMGRIGSPQAVVGMIVPVVIGGEFGGFIGSILNLKQVREQLEVSAGSSTMYYTLLDKNGNIILTNRGEQEMMAPFKRGQGSLNRLDENISQWIPTLPPNTSLSERWKSSFYVAETPVGNLAEWKLVLEQPVAPFQKALYARYTDALALVLLILLAALALAEFLSRRVVATTEKLSELTQGVPATLEAGRQPDWPQSAILETNNLIGNFMEMTQTLAGQFNTNRQLNESLERKVQQRTSALALSIAELKRSNSDLEQFAYAASHDMRQPLRMISSYLQLLETELAPVLTGDTRQNLAFATEGAQRMDQMLAALLDYSRIGRVGDAIVDMDSREAVDEALHYLGPAITQAGAEVRIEGEWPRLAANRDELRRLFQNLIDNGLKYRLEGRVPEVVVSAHASADMWQVCVRDNGVGLLPGQEARLFKVFERLQPRSRYPGTGIGLALCRKIVEHHNGSIRAESPGENQGCSFIFTLPLAGDGADGRAKLTAARAEQGSRETGDIT